MNCFYAMIYDYGDYLKKKKTENIFFDLSLSTETQQRKK